MGGARFETRALGASLHHQAGLFWPPCIEAGPVPWPSTHRDRRTNGTTDTAALGQLFTDQTGLCRLSDRRVQCGRVAGRAAVLAVGFFHDSIQPLLVRSRAQSFYDHAGERMTAQSLSFFADHVDVKSDRYAASLPYAMLSVWEDGRILLLRLGPGESRYVPKRALSPEDVQKLHALFPTGGQTQK